MASHYRRVRPEQGEVRANAPEQRPRPKGTIPSFPAPRCYRLPLFTEVDWVALEAVGRPATQPTNRPASDREQELISGFAQFDDPERRRAEVAWRLNHAFEEALWHAAHDAAVPRPSVHADQFSAVAKKAVELLHLLRLDERGEPADRLGAAQHSTVSNPCYLWFMRGVQLPPWPMRDETDERRAARLAESEPFWRTAELAQRLLPPGVAPPRPNDVLGEILDVTEASLNSEERAMEVAHWRIEEAAKAVPVALALLARLAEGAAAAPVMPSASPEFDDTFRRLLFVQLAGIYAAMFDTAPVCWLGRHEAENVGPAAKWANFVVRIADVRAPRHLLPNGIRYHDEGQRKRALGAINHLAGSKLSTFAHRMEQAWQYHLERDLAGERSRASSRE